MSLYRVAQLARVSPATVSRVVNGHSSVAFETAQLVREAIRTLDIAVAPRRSRSAVSRNGRATTVMLLVTGRSGTHISRSFEKLMSGVSDALNERGWALVLNFCADLAQLRRKLPDRKIAGLLIHGDCAVDDLEVALRRQPAVWLMANRHLPKWGDQVIANDAAIGEMAAQYLVGRGHRRVAHVGIGGQGWCRGLQSFSFARSADDFGVAAYVLEAPPPDQGGGPSSGSERELSSLAELLVAQLLASPQLPTGLFVAEDRMLPMMDRALRSRGMRPGNDVEIITCNNEQPHYFGVTTQPARIDIRPEAIGRRAVEQLGWRMREGSDVVERIRIMVDPVLIEPESPGTNGTHLFSDSVEHLPAEVGLTSLYAERN